MGVREGRPLYLLPGKKAVIRYAPELDRPGKHLDMFWVCHGIPMSMIGHVCF